MLNSVKGLLIVCTTAVLLMGIGLGALAYIRSSESSNKYALRAQIVKDCTAANIAATQACVRAISKALSSYHSYYRLSDEVQQSIISACANPRGESTDECAGGLTNNIRQKIVYNTP